MDFRIYGALLLFVAACATPEPRPNGSVPQSPRIANLRRAAALPWRDEGRCVVQEASHPWSVVVERCFHTLDTRRIQFRDSERRCPVASADAATLKTFVGICLLTQPELAVGAVVVIGAVVVAVAIHEELKEYERRRQAHPETDSSDEIEGPARQAPSSEEAPAPSREPQPAGLGRDWFPPQPPGSSTPQERRPECTPRRVPPKGGHPLHNTCADHVPLNAFQGANALVNGKAFDALQPALRVLWEVKTDNFDTYTAALQQIVVRQQVTELSRERELARACGFDFRVGVRSAAHKAALELAAPDLEDLIVLMDWC